MKRALFAGLLALAVTISGGQLAAQKSEKLEWRPMGGNPDPAGSTLQGCLANGLSAVTLETAGGATLGGSVGAAIAYTVVKAVLPEGRVIAAVAGGVAGVAGGATYVNQKAQASLAASCGSKPSASRAKAAAIGEYWRQMSEAAREGVPMN